MAAEKVLSRKELVNLLKEIKTQVLAVGRRCVHPSDGYRCGLCGATGFNDEHSNNCVVLKLRKLKI